MCAGIFLEIESDSKQACERCDQIDELFCLVAELQKEVGRLRSIPECEREIDGTTECGNASGNIYTGPGSMESSGAYLKCLFTNTSSMRNKQNELEVLISSQSYYTIGLNETWWNESHNWSAGMQDV